ncbi:hypothetical protein [Spirosoma sp. KNUC1025]|uniref:hypothetical protein n=1 Tax=Spirosoma sp. KNUC1025 TaxID=2894082 RepID=UPI003866683B|nr:hypothetical protein LN737_11920 [Spirosoma sp. KNUC1025]
MKINTPQFLAGLLMLVVFASCSRPVAYFQPSAREQFARTTPVKSEPVIAAEVSAPVAAVSTPAPTPSEQLAQANAALDRFDATVRNDSKLAADKTVQKRLNRVRTLLASTSAKADLTPTEVNAPKKMNLMQRFMLKKMNKKISKQLAPANPEKAMINSGTLAVGAVLVILGLLLLFLTTGTGVTVGIISLLVGAVILLIGLL